MDRYIGLDVHAKSCTVETNIEKRGETIAHCAIESA
jgi:hypothetical protein